MNNPLLAFCAPSGNVAVPPETEGAAPETASICGLGSDFLPPVNKFLIVPHNPSFSASSTVAFSSTAILVSSTFCPVASTLYGCNLYVSQLS